MSHVRAMTTRQRAPQGFALVAKGPRLVELLAEHAVVLRRGEFGDLRLA